MSISLMSFILKKGINRVYVNMNGPNNTPIIMNILIYIYLILTVLMFLRL